MVERGKPCANLTIPEDELEDCLEYLKKFCPTLKVYIKDSTDVYIYRYDHIKAVIENIPDASSSIYHWYLGKLFGISDVEMENFLKEDQC
jgi:hypothetical protein